MRRTLFAGLQLLGLVALTRAIGGRTGDNAAVTSSPGAETSVTDERVKRQSLWQAGPTIVAVITLAILIWQITVMQSQARTAADQLKQAADVDDRQIAQQTAAYLSQVVPTFDGRTVVIANANSLPVRESALWTIAVFSDDYFGTRGVEYELTISGVPACSTITIDTFALGTPTEIAPGDIPDQVETNLAIQSPSNEWFLLGDDGIPESIESPSDGSALTALHGTDKVQVSADTYWEGLDGVEVFDGSIVTGNVVTDYSKINASLTRGTCAE